MARTLRHKLRGENGQSAVEFAIVLPILAMMFLAIWQCGAAFHKYLVFTDAARVGARNAAVSLTAAGGPCAAAKTAIQNTVSATQWTNDLQSGARVTCTAQPCPGKTPGSATCPYTISISYPFTITVFFNRTGTMTPSATERLE
jgi:Flp pilus assembly protein TadG